MLRFASSSIWLLILSFCFYTANVAVAGKPRSISPSRQFIVYGATVSTRGAVCDLAERTKAALLRMVSSRDDWKTPLVINLDYPQANYPDAPRARLEMSQLGYGLKFQLNLIITHDLEVPTVQRELLGAILMEMMYRDRPNLAAGAPYIVPPDWLVDGLLASLPGPGSDEVSALLHSIDASDHIPSLSDLLAQRRAELDIPSRQLYQAYDRALLHTLLEMPGGGRALVRYLSDLPDAPHDSLGFLQEHFAITPGGQPDLWWTLAAAHLAAGRRYETLSLVETGQRLDRILRFTLTAPDGKTKDYSLGDYEIFRRWPATQVTLEKVARQLQLLGTQAHPSYRNVLQEVYELTVLIAYDKLRRVPQRLARVESYREVIEQQGREIDDYLNWYEATQSKTVSGAFTHLLAPSETARANLPRRRDPISVYLDSVELEAD
ncbi:MAG: hypothetical protein ACR2G0_07400 [Chthoniobacterales bacterium]